MYKKGLRCRICTGCGLCPGVTPGMSQTAGGEKEGGAMRVLSDSAFTENTASAVCGNKRLVTADLGTTTIAMLLYGPDGAVEDRYLTVNPQAVYGADVISRIRAAEDREQAEDMRGMVLRVLEQGLERFRKRLSGRESMRLVLAANTTMTYLLMGWDTTELGRAPFRASRLNGGEFEIAGVPCFVFPGVSAFIGGDITAGMYACSMSEGEEIMLLIDLGTNGEIVLGNRKRRIACATAAGPAFEGGANKGIWGADMISRIAALRREGLLDETGLLAESCFESGVKVGNIHVTQESVRAVQLAKGAIAAGIEILLGKYGIREEQVERVVLAGGFGYYLNPGDAALIGLLGTELAKKAIAGGNTVLSGALKAGGKLTAAAMQKRKEEITEAKDERTPPGEPVSGTELPAVERQKPLSGTEPLAVELQKLISGTEVLNLAEEADFNRRYIQAMKLAPSNSIDLLQASNR